MAFPKYVIKESQRKASGVSRIGEYRSTKCLATPWMMPLGKGGNDDSVVFLLKCFTSIVSIVVVGVVGLDSLLFLEDHYLPGFKFQSY